MKRIAALLGASTLLAAPAFAGGLEQPVVEAEVVPAPVAIVAQPSADWSGFYAGANIGYGKLKGDLAGTEVADADGAIGGVQAGYRWDFGQTVLGVEAAYSGSNVEDSATGVELKNKADLKLQLGYDLGQSLVYGTVGASRAKISDGTTSVSDTGWVAGLGYDYALTEQWTVGGEYLYHKYDDFNDSGVDIDGSTVALRANFKF